MPTPDHHTIPPNQQNPTLQDRGAMTGHHPTAHPPNPLTDTSRWTLAGHHTPPTTDHPTPTPTARALAHITHVYESMQDIVNQWPTCPLDGQLCGSPCCPIAALRDH